MLIAGLKTCDGGNLLNECIEWCKKLNVRCVTKGTDPILVGAKSDKFKLKKGLWVENDKEIRVALDKLKKVKYIELPNTKKERNYLKDMTLADARLWFKYRCQIIDNLKGNGSSQWKNNMARRLCTSGENETQEQLERCSFMKAGEDFLNECIEWCKKLNIRCFTRGTDPIPAKARTDEFNLKKKACGRRMKKK